MAVQNVKDLTVYRKAYRQAMVYFEVSKRFPPEERYALTGQGRRSSRSVCQNLRAEMTALNHEVGKMLGSMIANPDKFLLSPDSCLLTPAPPDEP